MDRMTAADHQPRFSMTGPLTGGVVAPISTVPIRDGLAGGSARLPLVREMGWLAANASAVVLMSSRATVLGKP